MEKERTLVIIKPDGIEKRITGLVLDRIEQLGLEMIGAKVAKVSKELAEEHYENIKGKPFFDPVVRYLLGQYHNIGRKRVFVFIFEGENAISKIRDLVGDTHPHKAQPSSIRGMFGQVKPEYIQNVIHASSSRKEAEREIALWFIKSEVLD